MISPRSESVGMREISDILVLVRSAGRSSDEQILTEAPQIAGFASFTFYAALRLPSPKIAAISSERGFHLELVWRAALLVRAVGLLTGAVYLLDKAGILGLVVGVFCLADVASGGRV